MASAPPMEPDQFGQPQPPTFGQPHPSTFGQQHPPTFGQQHPPTYEETMKAPQYAYSPTQPPPDYSKMAAYPPPQTHQPVPTGTYSQMHPQQPNVAGTSAVVNVQTVYVQPRMIFQDFPVQVQCPVCAQAVLSRVVPSSGLLTWLVCFGLSIVGCIYGCCLIPFCVDGLKDVKHVCPNCNALLGLYKRL